MEQYNKGKDDQGRMRIAVTVPWEEIADSHDDIVREYAGLPMSGFRPGKAPRPMVKKRFSREIITALERVCCRCFGREAVSETGEDNLGAIEAMDIQCKVGDPLSFTVRFFPVPAFSIPDFSPMKLDPESADPRDQLSRWLLDTVSFEIPDSMVQAEMESSEPTAAGSDAWKAAAERISLLIILKRIARDEGIEVDEADVDDRIRDTAAALGITEKKLKSDLEQYGGRERLRDLLLAEVTQDYLLDKYGT